MTKLIQFLNMLEDSEIFYRLSKIRDSILVEIAVPGQRWEVEFMPDGEIQTEVFYSDGHIRSESDVDALIQSLADFR